MNNKDNEKNIGTIDKKEQRLQWFKDAKFGMFIHWGLYSQLAGEWKGQLITRIGEQIMRFCEIPVKEYEQVAKEFNPVKFNAEEWVLIAKNAGMKYIVITAKHHDGFAMYDSKSSDYDIVDATPFKRDPMKELAEACKNHGIKLCFYYSQYQDWHHPHGAVKAPQWDGIPEEQKDFSIYMREKGIPQVTELLTQYGPIGLVWYDTPGGISKEDAKAFTDLVHQLQPDCLVSPRVGHDLGDYQGFGDNQVPSCSNSNVWETCATMNTTWGFRKNDHQWKDTATLIRLLVSIVSKGGNYLLNVGPTGEGVIPVPSVERLQEIGEWTKVNGEAIYGAKGCLIPYELQWGALTAKPGKLFIHFFQWPEREFTFYGIKNKVKKVYLLADKDEKAIEFTQAYDKANDCHRLTASLPEQAPDKHVSVLVLDIEGDIDIDATLMQGTDGDINLDAFLAKMHKVPENSQMSIDESGILEHWLNKEEWLSWEFKVTKPGTFNIEMNTFTEKNYQNNPEGSWEGGHQMYISAAGQELQFTVTDDERTQPRDLFHWQNVITRCGKITLDKPGLYTLKLKAIHLNTELGFGPKLKSVKLLYV
jgi:alpha-L-fucosidase